MLDRLAVHLFVREVVILLVGQKLGLLLHVPMAGGQNQQRWSAGEHAMQIMIQVAPP